MRPKVHERLRYAEWLREAQQFDKVLEQIELARTESETVDERDRRVNIVHDALAGWVAVGPAEVDKGHYRQRVIRTVVEGAFELKIKTRTQQKQQSGGQA